MKWLTERFTHVPTPLMRGPQQIKSLEPYQEYLSTIGPANSRRHMHSHFKFLNVRPREGVKEISWLVQIKKDVHLGRRLENNTFISSISRLVKDETYNAEQ